MATNDFVLCEIQATYKPKRGFRKPQLQNSSDIYALRDKIYRNGYSYREEAYVLVLNAANRVLGVCKISDGGLTATMVDVRIVMQHLLLANAVSFVLIHNHPSGNLKPSRQDDMLTEQVSKAAQIMNFRFLDHVIFTDEDGYYSYSDEGRL